MERWELASEELDGAGRLQPMQPLLDAQDKTTTDRGGWCQPRGFPDPFAFLAYHRITFPHSMKTL